MTIAEAAREEAAKFGRVLDDHLLEHVIWSHTGYPAFWNIPCDGATPEECFRKQVREWAADPDAAEARLEKELEMAAEAGRVALAKLEEEITRIAEETRK